MAPRANKRQQREQEELMILSGSTAAEESSGEEDVLVQSKSAFAALMAADDIDEDSGEGHKAKAKKPKKKKKGTSNPTPAKTPVEKQTSSPALSPSPSTPTQGPSKQERKALKKQKAKERKDGRDEIDRALEELSIKYPDLKSVSSKATTTPTPTSQPSQAFNELLSVTLSNLDPDVEMRKFFGAKAMHAARNSSTATTSNTRRQPASRSNLVRPQASWWPAKLREGLTIRPLSDKELKNKLGGNSWSDVHERWWTVEYSKRYKGVTMTFMRTVLSGDPEGFFGILRQVPWHADNLLQLAELYAHREEYSQAADFIDRALFTYERAFVGAFNFTSGANRLDFDHVENRPFFLALHRQVIDLERRGLFQTAFEFCRLLYSLDPWTDPHGALLHLDHLAVKAGKGRWLLDVYDLINSQTSRQDHALRGRVCVTALPGWAYARALALRSGSRSNESQQQESTEALKQAIIAFPSIVPLLADKAEIVLSSDIRSQGAFRIFTKGLFSSTEESLLHLLSHVYVQRSASLWKVADVGAWFAQTVQEIVNEGALPGSCMSAPGYQRFSVLIKAKNFPNSVARHVTVLGAPAQRLLSYLPDLITSGNNLACDPVPPVTRVNEYDDAFFQGAEDALSGTMSRRRQQRMLEQLIPDAGFRQQLQALFEGNPFLRQQFPGGLIQFAQAAGGMPDEMLEEILMGFALQRDRVNGDEMPGGMPEMELAFVDNPPEADMEDGEDLVVNEERDDPDVGHRDQGGSEEEEEEEEDGDEEEEEEEEEAVPLPTRVLRNIMSRFFGSSSNAGDAQDTSEDEDDAQPPRDGAGVD